jgi:hypothetical protein
MADLVITPSGVLAASASTAKAYGLAGTVITAGQAVYLDTNISPNVLRPASGSVLVQAQNVVGIALDSAAGSAQPIAYATAGDVTLPTSGGGTLSTGTTYVLSKAAAGGIAPSTDPTAGTATFISVLGLATSPTNLRVAINPIAAPR